YVVERATPCACRARCGALTGTSDGACSAVAPRPPTGGTPPMQDTMPLTEESQGMELVWIQPKWSRPQFELRARDTTLASLDWTCGSLALGRWGAAAYRFSRKGWLRPRVLVRSTAQCEADAPLATL